MLPFSAVCIWRVTCLVVKFLCQIGLFNHLSICGRLFQQMSMFSTGFYRTCFHNDDLICISIDFSLCEITITVLPWIKWFNPVCIWTSVSTSNDAAISSRMIIGASFRIALAMDSRWRSPPESLAPFPRLLSGRCLADGWQTHCNQPVCSLYYFFVRSIQPPKANISIIEVLNRMTSWKQWKHTWTSYQCEFLVCRFLRSERYRNLHHIVCWWA